MIDYSIPKELADKNCFIAGEWTNAASGETLDVISPVTGELLAKVPVCGTEEINKAVEAAASVRDEFKDLPMMRRVELCRRIAEILDERKDIIAAVETMENGKAYHNGALADIQEAVNLFKAFAEDILRWPSDVNPMMGEGKMSFSIHEGVGVAAIITPWNYPVLIPVETIAPCLVVGNPIVFKPAETTPLSAILLTRCIQDALEELDFPKGIFNLVTGPGPSTGSTLVSHPKVDLITFVGQPETGADIASKAGWKRTLLEMGGNGPQIVCKDANLKEAAVAAAFGSYYDSGQVCVATERILVHRDVHDEFVKLLLEETKKWTLGDPRDEKTTVGPLQNKPVAAKVDRHIADAREKGAKILCGGERDKSFPTDLYYKPTVIDGVSRDMVLNLEETFGPVAPIMIFDTDEEAVEIATEGNYGLQMAVFTNSLSKMMYYTNKLRTGTIIVNDTTCYWEELLPAFGGGGGTKSGYGRIASRYTLEDVTYIKAMTVDYTKVKED